MATPIKERVLIEVVNVDNQYLQIYVNSYGQGVTSHLDNCYSAEETSARICEWLKEKGW